MERKELSDSYTLSEKQLNDRYWYCVRHVDNIPRLPKKSNAVFERETITRPDFEKYKDELLKKVSV